MNEQSNPHIPQQNIILDTNILQYTGNKKFSVELILYLADLARRGFGFAISDVTYYELLSGTTVKQEQQSIELLDKFNRYFVEITVLIAASRLSTLYYHQCKLEGRTSHDISFEDKIIASTAILTGSLILTANINDFPRPFFQEAEEKAIFYRDRNITKMLILQLLRPNQTIILQRFQERPRG